MSGGWNPYRVRGRGGLGTQGSPDLIGTTLGCGWETPLGFWAREFKKPTVGFLGSETPHVVSGGARGLTGA